MKFFVFRPCEDALMTVVATILSDQEPDTGFSKETQKTVLKYPRAVFYQMEVKDKKIVMVSRVNKSSPTSAL